MRETAARLPAGRNEAIDIFRALTVLVMIVVNDWHGVQGLPAWMKHMPAEVDGMSFVDGVFPAFLFIVGLSVPFALQQRLALATGLAPVLGHVLGRAASLVLVGVFMVNAEEVVRPEAMPLPVAAWALASYAATFLLWGSVRGGPALAWPWRLAGALGFVALALLYRGGADGTQGLRAHWWGILGLIGWAYLLACAAYLLLRGRVVPLLAVMLLCVGYFAAGQLPALQSQPFWQMVFSQGGHASHAAIVLAGCVAALLLFDQRSPAGARRRGLQALAFALVMALAAAGLRPWLPVSKIAATPSWALFSAAACVLILLGLQHGLAGRVRSALASWLAPVAALPLVAYLIPFVVEALMQLAHLHRPAVLAQGSPGVATALAYALAVALLTRGLAARGLRLRL